MRIARSARRHGVADDDMRHALRLAIEFVEMDDLVLWIGPDEQGQLLEIGVAEIEGEPWIIHAMPARPQHLPGRG